MRAMGRLAARSLADTVSHVEQVHHAVAARALAVAGPAGHPVRALHDGITTGVYAAVRGAGLVTVLAAGELVGAAARWAPKTAPTPRSNLALAVLNATVGDELADQASPLAIPMAVRRDRVDVAPRRPALEVAFPEASSKVALFVHGLGETEESWRLHADRHGPGTESTYGSRLAGLRLHPRPCALQHRPPHLRERAPPHGPPRQGRGRLARSGHRDHRGRSLDGWPGRPQRVPLCTGPPPLLGLQGAPRLLPGLSPSGRRARAVGQCLEQRARPAGRKPAAGFDSGQAQCRDQGSPSRSPARRALAPRHESDEPGPGRAAHPLGEALLGQRDRHDEPPQPTGSIGGRSSRPPHQCLRRDPS